MGWRQRGLARVRVIEPRELIFLQLTWIASLLLFAFFLQAVVLLEPCILCSLQRLLLVIMMGGLVWRLFFERMACVLQLLQSLLLLLGWGLAWHHWQLQLNPAVSTACLPGLGVLWEYYSLHDIWSLILTGDGGCSQIDWQFLGLSIPAWLMVHFSGLGVLLGVEIRMKAKRIRR